MIGNRHGCTLIGPISGCECPVCTRLREVREGWFPCGYVPKKKHTGLSPTRKDERTK